MSEEQGEKKGFFSRLLKRDSARTETEHSDARRAVSPPEQDAAEESPEKKSFFRLRTGLSKTRTSLVGRLDELFFGKKQVDEQIVERLEEILVTADIGITTAYELLDSVTTRIKRREFDRPDQVMDYLKQLITDILLKVEAPLRVGFSPEPFVVMVIGVNGSGKTTTIAKIAARHKAAERRVLMVAGDTFRAAAVEQMQVWADRIGCPVVKGKDKSDPSAIVFEALDRSAGDGTELVLVDTAGRLHTRVPLMDQLKKIRRTIEKKQSGAPHETLLVIDASMGQNAINQAKTFSEAIPVTGIAVTKLDGTAKGGVLVGISNELKIPVRYIGIGEKMDDLRDFNARDFVEALFAGSDLPENG